MAWRLLYRRSIIVLHHQWNINTPIASIAKYQHHHRPFNQPQVNILHRFYSSNPTEQEPEPIITEVKEEPKTETVAKGRTIWQRIERAFTIMEYTTYALQLFGLIAVYFVFKWVMGIVEGILGDKKFCAELKNELSKITVASWQQLGLVLASTNEEVQNIFGDDIYILKDTMDDPDWSEKLKKMMHSNGRVESEFEITNADQSQFGNVRFGFETKIKDEKEVSYLTVIVKVQRSYLWDKKIVLFDGAVDEKDFNEMYKSVKTRLDPNKEWFVDRLKK